MIQFILKIVNKGDIMVMISQILGCMLVLSIILTFVFFIVKGADPKVEFKNDENCDNRLK